jgi:integrase
MNLKPLIISLYFCGVRLGEALQIEWSHVNLDEAPIRLEEEQTKNSEPRTVPFPDVLKMLDQVKDRTGPVFDATNLQKAWGFSAVDDSLLTPCLTSLIRHLPVLRVS